MTEAGQIVPACPPDKATGHRGQVGAQRNPVLDPGMVQRWFTTLNPSYVLRCRHGHAAAGSNMMHASINQCGNKRMERRIDAHIARTQFGQIMDRAVRQSERFIVDRRGEPAVVIMSVQDFRTDSPNSIGLRRTGGDLHLLQTVRASLRCMETRCPSRNDTAIAAAAGGR